jgi:hypothetical protein
MGPRNCALIAQSRMLIARSRKQVGQGFTRVLAVRLWSQARQNTSSYSRTERCCWIVN